MKSSNRDIAAFEAVARQEAAVNWYAIADSAQHPALPSKLVTPGREVRCLFDVAQMSPVAEQAPHLVELDSPLADSSSWNWISLYGKSKPCVSVIATALTFEALFRHLVQFTQVTLPDGDTMFFAFWDPAVLGTLVGQSDDHTLHVKGPVLASEQKSALIRPTVNWWYWDREGLLHLIARDKLDTTQSILPLWLSQSQVDELVEASVPDHVLYYVELNQPLLIDDLAPVQRYQFVRGALRKGREIGLSSMGDLVNFVCLELIYGERMGQDKFIIGLLEDVKKGKATLLEISERLP